MVFGERELWYVCSWPVFGAWDGGGGEREREKEAWEEGKHGGGLGVWMFRALHFQSGAGIGGRRS